MLYGLLQNVKRLPNYTCNLLTLIRYKTTMVVKDPDLRQLK